MVITLVIDMYGETTNGTTVTARRLAETLKKHGHEVRVITCSDIQEDGVYVVEKQNIPIVKNIIKKRGMELGQPNDKLMREAIAGSDVVHFLMPFKMERHGLKIAKEMGIPVTGAFHVQPENVSYNLGLEKIEPLNNYLYKRFHKFYKNIDHIHCPSDMIKNELVKHEYDADFHVISNGVADKFVPMEVKKPVEIADKYVIMMTARFSREKRQDLIIKAIAESKYKDKIQLILCGKGVWQNYLQKLSDKYLTNPVIFKFVDQDELIKTINYSDLYVHASDVDIEAIGCIEAFSCGLVPIISNNELVATKQFALSPSCLFETGNYKDLAKKIDYFIEHPQEKAKLSKQYLEFAKQYRLEHCVQRMEDMFKLAIEDYKKDKVAK